jgi:hypothetical protein
MENGERYWVDIKKYNTDHKLTTFFGWLAIKHKNILEIPNLLSFIKDNITNKIKNISEYSYIFSSVPHSSDKKRLQYSLHSPLTLDLYDDQGRHTGVNSDGQIEEQIPGTYYSQFGDVKYIFTSDEDSANHIVMKGYDEGTFTFSVDELQDDKSVNKITFKDMPTTSETKVTFDITSDLAGSSEMSIDEDGDGNIDSSAVPILNGIVTSDGLVKVDNNEDDSDDSDDNDEDHKKEDKKSNGSSLIAKNGVPVFAETIFADLLANQDDGKYFGKSDDGNEENDKEVLKNEEVKKCINKEMIVSLIVLIILVCIVILRARKETFNK